MEPQVVVWNLDARNRPELEVELEVELDDVDAASPIEVIQLSDLLELEDDDSLVQLAPAFVDFADDDPFAGGWFVDDGVPIIDELQIIYDAPPLGYEQAYRASA
jgi:hypothetical protein